MKMITFDAFSLCFSYNLQSCATLQNSDMASSFSFMGGDFLWYLRSPGIPGNYFYWWPNAYKCQYKAAKQTLLHFLMDRLSERQTASWTIMDYDATRNNKTKDVLDALLQGHQEMKPTKNGISVNDLLHDVLLSILFAGYDTTSIALTYSLYLISRSKRWNNKVSTKSTPWAWRETFLNDSWTVVPWCWKPCSSIHLPLTLFVYCKNPLCCTMALSYQLGRTLQCQFGSLIGLNIILPVPQNSCPNDGWPGMPWHVTGRIATTPTRTRTTPQAAKNHPYLPPIIISFWVSLQEPAIVRVVICLARSTDCLDPFTPVLFLYSSSQLWDTTELEWCGSSILKPPCPWQFVCRNRSVSKVVHSPLISPYS